MRFQKFFSFGSIRIDGTTYEHDVVIDRGEVRKRKKRPSKKFREAFGHADFSKGVELYQRPRPQAWSRNCYERHLFRSSKHYVRECQPSVLLWCYDKRLRRERYQHRLSWCRGILLD